MAASALSWTGMTPPLGRPVCRARHNRGANDTKFGKIVLKLAPNYRVAFTNWLRFRPNASHAGGPRLVLQDDQL